MLERKRLLKNISLCVQYLKGCLICIFQVLVLGDIGGRNLEETTKRTLKFVMSNTLALRFNLMGRNEKRAFETTALFTAVYQKF